MKTVLALAVWFLLSPAAHGQDPTKKPASIVGTWRPTKGEIPAGATVEFTKDGKMKLTVTVSGQTVTGEATFKVDGDRITTSRLGPDGKEKADTAKIKKLTDKELVIEDDKGRALEFKRVN
jgi:uncharacterized protein (TIGR03066 family)